MTIIKSVDVNSKSQMFLSKLPLVKKLNTKTYALSP